MDERIHVAHILHDLERGGLQNGLANLIERLDAARWRHTVIAIAGLGPGLDLVAGRPNVRVRLVARRPGRDWRLPLRIARALRADRPHLVRTYNWATWLEGWAAARLARVPAVIHSEHQQPYGESPAERRRRGRARRFLARRCDAVVALSRDIARGLVASADIDPARIVTIPNGVDCERFERAARDVDRARKRAGIGVPEDALVLGVVGRLVAEKGYRALLEALPQIAAREPRALVVIAGAGPLRDSLERRADTLGVRGRLRLLGDRPDVPELYGVFDLFVLPSVSEGICNTILEAMAAGLPIVTTPVGGTPEIVEDGRSAIFVPPDAPDELAHAIAALLADPERRAALGAEAARQARVERSIETMVRRYERLYTKVLWRRGVVGRPAGEEPAAAGGADAGSPCAASGGPTDLAEVVPRGIQ